METKYKNCGLCHECGRKLAIVCDGEEWCEDCQAYRRYRSHGWAKNSADRNSEHCPVFAIAERANERAIVELTPDGRMTAWTPGTWGPVGSSGIPHPETTIRAPRNNKEAREILAHRRSLARSMRSQTALVTAARMRRAARKGD